MKNKRHAVTEEKNKNRLPVRAYLIYLSVFLFLLTGVTFSKYVASSNGTDSARVASIEDITVTETGSFIEDTKLLLQPGVDLEKKAVVNFGGSEVATYVFIEVSAPGWTKKDNHTAFSAGNGAVSWVIDDFWTYLLSENDRDVYFAIVEPNRKLVNEDIIQDGIITVSSRLKNSELSYLNGLSLEFCAWAVQYDGFGNFDTEAEHAQAAWDAVNHN
ncbi:MAG: hypothetical protein ACI39R_05155 [Lachnospiraceae bacterium]